MEQCESSVVYVYNLMHYKWICIKYLKMTPKEEICVIIVYVQ